MKIKLLLTAILLAGFQNFNAQEIQATTIDSVKVSDLEMQKQQVDEKAKLDQQLKDDKKALKEQQKIEDDRKDAERKLKNEQQKVQKEQDKLKREQRKFEKEQSRLAAAEKSVAKNKSKLEKANKDLIKLQEKQSKAVSKGKLTPVEVEKGNLKITKQQLKIKEIEEDISDSQKKLDKLR